MPRDSLRFIFRYLQITSTASFGLLIALTMTTRSFADSIQINFTGTGVLATTVDTIDPLNGDVTLGTPTTTDTNISGVFTIDPSIAPAYAPIDDVIIGQAMGASSIPATNNWLTGAITSSTNFSVSTPISISGYTSFQTLGLSSSNANTFSFESEVGSNEPAFSIFGTTYQNSSLVFLSLESKTNQGTVISTNPAYQESLNFIANPPAGNSGALGDDVEGSQVRYALDPSSGNIIGTVTSIVGEVSSLQWGSPSQSLLQQVEDALADIKKAFNGISQLSNNFLLDGLAASSVAVVAPEVFPPSIALTPELLDMEAELLVAGNAIKGQFPIGVPGDPPLPSITAGGLITSQMADTANQINTTGQEIFQLIEKMRSDINQIIAAIQANDLTTAAALEQTFDSDFATFQSLAASEVSLLSALVQELQNAGVPDILLTEADLQAYLNGVLTNGFPAAELPLFADLGLSQSDIDAILADLGDIDISGAPDSLYSTLTESASLFQDAATSVPEPSSLLLLLLPLMVLFGLQMRHRVRLRVNGACRISTSCGYGATSGSWSLPHNSVL